MADNHKNYSMAPNAFDRSIDDFAELCRLEAKCKIEIIEVDLVAVPSTISATCWKMKDGYLIGVRPEPNICWNRFVKCKELFQVLLDDPQYYTMQIFQLIQLWVSIAGITTPYTMSELMAEIAAMEYLFPYTERVSKKKSNMTQADYLEIAKIYKIPRVKVEEYLSDPSMEILGKYSRK